MTRRHEHTVSTTVARTMFKALAAVTRSVPTFKGKEPALRALSRPFLPRLRGLHCDVRGVTWELDIGDLIDFRTFFLVGHDRHVVEYLASILGESRSGPRSPVLWDVGANVGTIALPLAALVPDLEIHAFDPSPAVFRRLQRNVELNPILRPRVVLHEVALSDRSGSLEFFPSRMPTNSGCGSFVSMDNTATAPVHVAAWTGDDLVSTRGVPPPDVIKIDVEGFEDRVLLGLSGLIRSGRPLTILFEHSPYRLRARGVPFDSVTSFLTGHGFHLTGVNRDGTTEALSAGYMQEEHDIAATRHD